MLCNVALYFWFSKNEEEEITLPDTHGKINHDDLMCVVFGHSAIRFSKSKGEIRIWCD